MVVINDWKLGRIGDEILSLEAGVSVNSDANGNGSNYYILKTSAVGSGKVDLNEVKPVVPRDITRLKCSLTANSILISRMNTPELVGECGYVESDNDKIFLPDRIWQTILKQGSQLNCKWLNYVLNTDQLRQYIKNTATGTSNSMKNISKDQIMNIEIYFPEPDEQNAIAEALSDADSLIASLEKLIAKKKAIKQGAMQDLLTGKKRLPGFSGEWVDSRFGELGSFYGGLSGKKKEDFGHGAAKYITFLNVLSNTVINTHIFEKVDIKSDDYQNLVQYGDLFFNTSSETPEEVGMCAVLLSEASNTYLNSFCFGFRLKDNAHDPLFLSYLFNSNYGRRIMLVLAQGATRYNLSKINFAETVIRLPDKKEQKAIIAILSDMDAEIEQLEKKLAKYRLIKQGMMQELLTGRIRLIGTNKAESAPKGHNKHYDDAIAISAIVNAFYDDRFILGRVKVQKLLYLLRRKQDADVSAFKKKAAGPYNEEARYKGGESIAVKSGYIAVERSSKGSKFSKGGSITAALKYVGNMQSDIDWLLEKFRFYNTNKEIKNLEVLATVDMAVCELEKDGKAVNLDAVKDVIHSNKEWAPKLQKPYFTDAAINQAILESKELFS